MPRYDDENESEQQKTNVNQKVPEKDEGPEDIESKQQETEIKQEETEVEQQETKPIIEENKEETSRFSIGSTKPAPTTSAPEIRPTAPIQFEQEEKISEAPLRKYGEALAKPDLQEPSTPISDSPSWKPSETIIPPAQSGDSMESPERMEAPSERVPETNIDEKRSSPLPPLSRSEPSAQPEKSESNKPQSEPPSPTTYQRSDALKGSDTPKPLLFTKAPMAPVSTTKATEPAKMNQEVVGIVNNAPLSRSSELLKSIRDRIAAHEASEKAFCDEIRGLVDTLESAFKEEEGKAGQLTQEISNLISRYSQEGP